LRKEGKDVVTSFRVNEELWREVRAYAVRHGITVKQLIEFLLQKELKENRILKEMKKNE
jgi:predicted DNA-binding ribbon-helix-helix protein